jgi:hypothetical protein
MFKNIYDEKQRSDMTVKRFKDLDRETQELLIRLAAFTYSKYSVDPKPEKLYTKTCASVLYCVHQEFSEVEKHLVKTLRDDILESEEGAIEHGKKMGLI